MHTPELIINRFSLYRAFVFSVSLFALSNQVYAQPDFSTLSEYPGPEILKDAMDIQTTEFGICALVPAGQLICAPQYNRHEGQSAVDGLNNALDKIVAFSSGDNDICGLGDNGQIVCTNSTPPSGRYQSLSNISAYGWACAIGLDNEVACWNDNNFLEEDIEIPPNAKYLKQISINLRRFCGVDLSDDLVCWGSSFDAPPSITSIEGVDSNFADTNPDTIGKVRSVSLGDYSSCVLRLDGKAECFGADALVPEFNRLLSPLRFESLSVSYQMLSNFPFAEMAICGTVVDANPDCWRVPEPGDASPDSLISVLPQDLTPRLLSHDWDGCLLDTDDNLICYVAIAEAK